MKSPYNKLDKLERKQIFKVPDQYFDKLATEIQTKAISAQREPVFRFPVVVKYALPVLVLAIAVIFWMQNNNVNSTRDVHQLLAEIPAADIIDYLDESDLTLVEIMDVLEYDVSDVDGLYLDESDSLSVEDMDALLEDYEITGEYL